MIVPVILAGGEGTRLWPLSRKEYPKQFLGLINNSSLFQNTITRLPKKISDPLIICNEEYRFIAAAQLKYLKRKNKGIILEPIGKNTAPAIALAALNFTSNSEDPILLVLPADHSIEDNNAFHRAIDIAENLALKDNLVTFGIHPISPETGYGYIKAKITNESQYYEIESFKEKPKKNIAKKYLDSKNYFWNSGMFMFKASTFLRELKKYSPNIFTACQKSFVSNTKEEEFMWINSNEFYKCPSDSIDYAVMEHTNNGVIIPLEAGWNDVGSWSMLHNVLKKDSNDNVIKGDVVVDNVKDSFIYSSNRLVSVVGLSNIVIIDTQDILLVIDKNNEQNITNIVKKITSNEKSNNNLRRKKQHWGHSEIIYSEKEFEVKRILINPKSVLSFQKHYSNNEYLLVLSGLAVITSGQSIIKLNKSQSTYKIQNKLNQIENSGDTPLEIIKVQTG